MQMCEIIELFEWLNYATLELQENITTINHIACFQINGKLYTLTIERE